MRYNGVLEKYGRGFAAGWAHCIDDAAPVSVTITADGIEIGTAVANIARPDLMSRDKGPCGFEAFFGWDIAGASVVEARIVGTDFLLRRSGPTGNNFGIVEIEASDNAPEFRGAIEEISAGVVSGWLEAEEGAADPKVELKLSGKTISETAVKEGKFALPYSIPNPDYYARILGLDDPTDGLEVFVVGTDIQLPRNEALNS